MHCERKNFQFRKMDGTQLTWESKFAKEEATRLALVQYFAQLPELALKYLNIVIEIRGC